LNGKTFESIVLANALTEEMQVSGSQQAETSSGLSDVVVLECGGSVAAAFSGVLLADFGARVFVCEEPPNGSVIRSLGGPAVQRAWWKILARNKRSIAIDTRNAGSAPVMKSICDCADLILMGRHQRDDGVCPWLTAAANSVRSPLVIDIFPTGSDRPDLWPWSTCPELAAAATGLMALTGERDGEPVQPEFPLCEYLCGMQAATHALAELRRRKLTGHGPTQIKIAEHEALQRMIEWQIPVATALGRPELRDGNNFSMAGGISYIHRTKDGHYVATSAATQSVARRLLVMVGGEALRDDPRFDSPESRSRNMPHLIAIIDRWLSELTLAQIMQAAHDHDVVIGPIYEVDNIICDDHIRARKNIIEVMDDDGTAIPMPGVLPNISGIKTEITHLGPKIGCDSDLLLAYAGFTKHDVDNFRSSKIIWT
jgi:crotonobetainyl-CoA:carnitine CoA-transferase CaiB-like acyl-CoA transferase